MLWVLCAAALAGAEAVEAGERREVVGPAVVLDEHTYRTYVQDSRSLESCESSLRVALDSGILANGRALRVTERCKEQLEAESALQEKQMKLIADHVLRLEELQEKNDQLKKQRNFALGAALGLLSASTFAVLIRRD